MVRVYIVDSHAIFRRGLAASVAIMDDVEDVRQADGVRDALEDPALMTGELVIVDSQIRGGLDLIAAVREAGAGRVLVCTAGATQETVTAALAAGASGVLSKEAMTHDGLQAAMATIIAGTSVIVPDVARASVGRVAAPTAQPDVEPPADAAPTARLNERERSVLALIADGLPSREVAEQLNYSERTIKNVLHDIVKKLNARSRSHAVAQAVRDGLI